jgi:hypothetical protein
VRCATGCQQAVPPLSCGTEPLDVFDPAQFAHVATQLVGAGPYWLPPGSCFVAAKFTCVGSGRVRHSPAGADAGVSLFLLQHSTAGPRGDQLAGFLTDNPQRAA